MFWCFFLGGGEVLERFGMFYDIYNVLKNWDAFGHFGKFWYVLRHFGTF